MTMTVPEVNGWNRYVANGSTLNYTYNFAISDPSEILVMQRDDVLIYGSHYNLTGVCNSNGGQVQMFFFAPDGTPITIVRRQALAQLINFLANSSYDPLTVGNAFDDAAKADQMLAERIGRAALFYLKSTYRDLSMDDPIASQLLRWRSDLSGIESIGISELEIGGTTATLSAGRIVFASGPTSLDTSSRLLWDNTNFVLDITQGTPHIAGAHQLGVISGNASNYRTIIQEGLVVQLYTEMVDPGVAHAVGNFHLEAGPNADFFPWGVSSVVINRSGQGDTVGYFSQVEGNVLDSHLFGGNFVSKDSIGAGSPVSQTVVGCELQCVVGHASSLVVGLDIILNSTFDSGTGLHLRATGGGQWIVPIRIESDAQHIVFKEMDQALPAGMWRIVTESDQWRIDRSTHASIEFGTLITPILITAEGQFTIIDGVSSPTPTPGRATIFVDIADGKLKVKHGGGAVVDLEA